MAMFDALLASKVTIPEPTQAFVARPRLTGALEDSLVRHRLTVVSAPAGYGKTTLLAAWARTTTTPVGWLSLDEDDNDPLRFLRGLLASWERIWPELASSPVALLLGSQEADPQTALAAFINARCPDRRRPGAGARRLSPDPGDRCPTSTWPSYWITCRRACMSPLAPSRTALPLARYRARGQLLELGAHDLRFTLDEAADFLRAMQVTASSDMVARLGSRA
jgi:LuxR family maltose regulon positive regulatory protein